MQDKKYCIAVRFCDGSIRKDRNRQADTIDELKGMMTDNERRFGHTYACETSDESYEWMT